jgi:hypothetical protein
MQMHKIAIVFLATVSRNGWEKQGARRILAKSRSWVGPSEVDLSIAAKFSLIYLLSLLGSLAGYEMIKGFNLTRWLFGMKPLLRAAAPIARLIGRSKGETMKFMYDEMEIGEVELYDPKNRIIKFMP